MAATPTFYIGDAQEVRIIDFSDEDHWQVTYTRARREGFDLGVFVGAPQPLQRLRRLGAVVETAAKAGVLTYLNTGFKVTKHELTKDINAQRKLIEGAGFGCLHLGLTLPEREFAVVRGFGETSAEERFTFVALNTLEPRQATAELAVTLAWRDLPA